jgi:hypothetical protein
MTRPKATDAKGPDNSHRNTQGLQEDLSTGVLKPFQ